MDHIPADVRNELESCANVVGTGIGPKRVGERETGEDAVVVFVSRKVPEAQLSESDRLPRTVTIDGEEVQTDVQEVGDVRTQAAVRPVERTDRNRKRRWRPAPAGVSCGHPEVSAGTLGTPALRTESGETVALTNAHVAAPVGSAERDDPVLQPGPADGGDAEDRIGELREWGEIHPDEPNRTDSALVAVDEAGLRDDVLGIGPFRGWTDAEFGEEYVKSGRTTGVTAGDLRSRDARIRVGGYYDEPVVFEGVDVFGPMSAGGDSGSVIGIEREDGFYGVSLLFAGSDRTTLGIPMETVQEEHGELTPVSADETRTSFRDRVERRLAEHYGEGVTTDEAVDFRVDAWPSTLRIAVAETASEALDAVGSTLAATEADEVPVVVYPADERTDELERVGFRIAMVGLQL
ncbi:hypothetical protein [Halegenticoccus tardaugens]|uniref:hypothetical protein n=1 Tax=Halegenticoccus tardaugens TaxID=2071624 RepID=UPI00100C11FD|nr:hypothetical protein [Halegenticoccus tardaugens]